MTEISDLFQMSNSSLFRVQWKKSVNGQNRVLELQPLLVLFALYVSNICSQSVQKSRTAKGIMIRNSSTVWISSSIIRSLKKFCSNSRRDIRLKMKKFSFSDEIETPAWFVDHQNNQKKSKIIRVCQPSTVMYNFSKIMYNRHSKAAINKEMKSLLAFLRLYYYFPRKELKQLCHYYSHVAILKTNRKFWAIGFERLFTGDVERHC